MHIGRFDRTATMVLFHPCMQMLGGSRGLRVPILMYHSVSEQSDPSRHPYYDGNTSPRIFAHHMSFLRESAYSSVDVATALDFLQAGNNVKKPVVITFDDGYRDIYTDAFPNLVENGLTATVFLATGLVGTRKDGRECLTWREVRELYSQGIEFGSHTVNHPELVRLGPKEVEEEIGRSKDAIEQKLGAPVKSFSYPYAFPEADKKFVRTLRNMLEKQGYQNGVSTIIGRAGSRSDRFFMPRIPANSWDDLSFFRAKLEGGYDWLSGFQYASKWLREKAGWLPRTF